ncbi:uncharacterized protein LOC120334390 isoform X1 [Styela clava]
MLIFAFTEMEDDGRRSSKKSSLFKWVTGRSSRPSPPGPGRRRSGHSSSRELYPPTERRPLRSVPLVGPHYRVEPEILVTEFVEKEVKYLGTISDLDCNFDATDRASLLKIVDEQQALDLMPCVPSYENDIIVSFSVHNIKLLRRDGEKMIHRIQTHKIAAVGYVRDDNQHLVFIKFASELNPKMCNLSILCCDTKTAAEEVCSLAQQVFQLVYTDSTIDFLDKSIMDGAITPKNHSYSTDDSDKKDTVTVSSRDYAQYSLNKSADSLILSTTSKSTNGYTGTQPTAFKRMSAGQIIEGKGSSSTLPQPIRHSRYHRRSGSSGSSSNNNIPPITHASTLTLTSPVTSTQTFPVHNALQLHDYITVLKEQLTNIELKEFAKLLNQFRTGGILIQDFSNQLLQMYTEERKHLLLGMRHFIPNASDLTFFNKFLKDNNVEDISADSATESWWAQAPRVTPRTLSETEESTASTSVTTGNVTAVSVSSSGSERASTSIVSNDDSGEWKDVLGNIEKFGIYPSTDSSGGGELNASFKTVNGTPATSGTGILELDPPSCTEETIIKSYVAPVAAPVPEEFQDAKEENVASADTKSLKLSPKKMQHTTSQSLGTEFSRTPQKVDRKSTETRKSLSDTTLQTMPLTNTNLRTFTKSKEKNSPVAGQGGNEPGATVPISPKKTQPSKPQKEHRKKKKHKKDEVVAML